MMNRSITIIGKLNIPSVVIFIMVATLITGCSSTKTTIQTSTVKTSSDDRNVWKACIESLPAISFSARYTESASGLITAEEAVAGGKGNGSRLYIRISREAGNTIVAVKYAPPPGTEGNAGTAAKFVEALKQRIPDLEPVIINSSEKTSKSSQ